MMKGALLAVGLAGFLGAAVFFPSSPVTTEHIDAREVKAWFYGVDCVNGNPWVTFTTGAGARDKFALEPHTLEIRRASRIRSGLPHREEDLALSMLAISKCGGPN